MGAQGGVESEGHDAGRYLDADSSQWIADGRTVVVRVHPAAPDKLHARTFELVWLDADALLDGADDPAPP